MLRLYVTGMTPRSRDAVIALEAISKEHPQLARDEQIVAVPMLVKQLPEPLRRLIGNMSDLEQVLLGLDLQWKAS